MYGSIAIGLEIQETYWAYTDLAPIGNVIYRKVDLIYKGTSTSSSESKIDSMYICHWSDPDVGKATDDLVGCDTSLNLGYAYNSVDADPYYEEYDLAPPAVGYSFLQGVSKYTGNNSDSAVFNFKWRKGYKYFNLKHMNVFVYNGVNADWTDPDFEYNGTLEFYNIMRGYKPEPHYPSATLFPSQLADYRSLGTYLLAGDPVTNTGKIDGIYSVAAFRRIYVISGPFSMELGDTAEVVIAFVGGMGEDHLSSVTNLKYNAKGAKTIFDYFVDEMTAGTLQIEVSEHPLVNEIPDNYTLSQNYPNPFNSATTIRYGLVNPAFVSLILYDVLGREVKRLVNEQQEAGNYEVSINANKLASGAYFYRIIFENSDNKLMFDGLNKTMKMILLK